MRRFPDLLIGFLLGFATLLAIFLLTSDIAAHYEICENTKEGAKECVSYNVLSYAMHKVGAAFDTYNAVITAIATAFIAWFTLSLRQSTDKLWDAGERQLKLLAASSAAQSSDMQNSLGIANRSAKATEEAAKASTISAKAIIGVELPIVSIAKLEMHRAEGISGQIIGGEVPEEFTLVVDFKNRGRTAAELQSLTIQCEIIRALPDTPIYKFNCKYPFSPGIYMEANKLLPTGNGRFPVKLLPGQVSALEEESAFLWVFGFLAYADFMGEPHQSPFCARWLRYGMKADKSWGPVGFIYDSSTPAAYTRQT
jgi:hypothetical protein